MIDWLTRWLPKPSTTAIDRVEASTDRMNQLVARREQQAGETERTEQHRRERLRSTDPIYALIVTGHHPPKGPTP